MEFILIEARACEEIKARFDVLSERIAVFVRKFGQRDKAP